MKKRITFLIVALSFCYLTDGQAQTLKKQNQLNFSAKKEAKKSPLTKQEDFNELKNSARQKKLLTAREKTVISANYPFPTGRIPQTKSLSETTVFLEDFENSPIEPPYTLPSGWTDIPTPNGFGWSTGPVVTFEDELVPGHSGIRFASIFYHGTVAHNAWAITPEIGLTAGKPYKISFWVNMAGYYTYERLEVKLGTGANPESLNTLIFDNGQRNYLEWTEISYEYIPPTDGNYFIGFHSISPASEDYTFFDDVKVEELIATAPAAPSNFIATPDADGAHRVTLAWTNPSTTRGGSPLTSLNSLVIQRNGTTIHTIDSPTPDANDTWIDNSPTNGNYTYLIYATNADGPGSSVSQTVFVGSDPCVDGINNFPYSESFEDQSTLDCWNVYDADGSGELWGTWWELVSERSHTGTFSVKHKWTSPTLGRQDGWLISPKVVIPDGKVIKLSFWSFNEYPNDYEKNSIWISENSSDPLSGHYQKVWEAESVSEDWVETEISLASFTGKEIYIAFRYEGLNAHSWYIDDLNFTEFQGIDAGVSAIVAPVTGSLTNDESIVIKVKNFGTEALNDVPVEVQIDNETPITGIVPSIALGGEEVYTFPTVDLSIEKTYTIKAYTKLETDTNAANDTATVKVTNTGDCTITEFPYNEGFEEEGRLLCWSKFYYDEDAETNGWALITGEVHGGGHSIYHIFGPAAFKQDGWLVSPKIRIPADGVYRFTFWSCNQRTDWYGKNSVWISKNGNDPQSGNFVEVWSPTSVTYNWEETKINLTQFAGEDIYIAFRYEGYDAHSWFLDDVKVELLTGSDAGVTAIVSPASGPNLTSTETITLKVRNFGAEELTNVPVKVSVDGGAPVSETIPSIGLDQEVEYTFTSNKLDLSAIKTYTIKAYTGYPADTDFSNDTTTLFVSNDGNTAVMGHAVSITSCNIPFVDDGNAEYYRESPNETQTITFYPETSDGKMMAEFTAFHSTPYELAYWGGYFVETLGDTLYVYNGNTVDESLLIDILTGNLNENLPLPYRSSAPDGSLTFVFKKQSNLPKAGWSANITCFTPQLDDAAVIKILSPVKDEESPAQVKALIANYGANPIESLDVAYTLNDNTPVIENYTGTIAPNATVEFTFAQKADFPEYTDYTLKVYTLLAGDGNLTNDTASFSFTHRESVTLYGYRIYDEAFSGVDGISAVSFNAWDPSVVTQVSDYKDDANIICAGEYIEGHIYAYSRSNDYSGTPANFIKLTKDWEEVSKESITAVPHDLTYDHSTKTLYGVLFDMNEVSMVLQTVDLATGELTNVVNISNVNNHLYTIAADKNGNLYGVDYRGNLVSIDKGTGVATLIGSTGIDPMYFQSMAFDHNTGRLFWAMHNVGSEGKLIELDPATGKANDLGVIGGNAQIVALHTTYSHDKIVVPEPNKQTSFVIFPNPAKDAVYISHVPENSIVQILDLTGRVLESHKMTNSGNNVKLDLNLNKGVYFIQINNSNTKAMQKLIVK
ncbi:MAG: choice-of-anchor J domain-containing protein [Dysgonamonadaceae bacterium]|jgi:hypothetical protein|nr:choice-of-anchor J domain-containing protein [Dysgonamonadaceae bacterium]